MNPENLAHLIYRRQYLIAPGEISIPFRNISRRLTEEYVLYTHIDLLVNEIIQETRTVVLLGDIFDFEKPRNGNREIIQEISALSFRSALDVVSRYSGRFVILWIERGRITILHDATATRKVYYTFEDTLPWVSSQPHLLARVRGFDISAEPSRQAFYRSSDFESLFNSNLGNTTCYEEIIQLMPNHYLNLKERKAIRFWPVSPLKKIDIGEAVERCTVMLSGFMESVVNRYRVMLPVTAGSDSRLMMSATRKIKDDVLYYINKDRALTEEKLDIKIPNRLMKHLNLEFKVLDLPTEIDASFEKIYFYNNPLASKTFLPHIYNYYLHYQDRVNLPGNIGSAPWGVYHMRKNKITARELLNYSGIKIYDYVYDYYKNWVKFCQPLCIECNLNVSNLFYWEERLANWGTQITMEKDIAQEDFNLYNSRLFNELFLSVPLKYNNEPDKKIHEMIIRNLWPELMIMPFNPYFMNRLKSPLARLGIFTFTGKMYYRFKKLLSLFIPVKYIMDQP